VYTLINYLLIFILLVNTLSLNYAIGSITGLPGQSVSAFLSLILLLIFFYIASIGRLSLPSRTSRFVGLTLILLVAIPFFGYLVNYSWQGLEGFLFWMKRLMLNLGSFAIGLTLLQRLRAKSWVRLSEVVFLLAVGTLFLSYFFPQESRLLFSGGESQWDYLDSSGIEAVGATLNANGSVMVIVVAYVVMNIIVSRDSQTSRIVRSTIFDGMLLASIAITGSRSGMLVAIVVFSLLKFQSFWLIVTKQRLPAVYLRQALMAAVVVMVLLAWAFSAASEIISINGIDRLLNFAREDNFESNHLRYAALLESLDLIYENPVLGLGFENTIKAVYLMPHNMFVAYALNNGIILGLYYPIYLYMVGRRIFADKLTISKITLLLPIVLFSFFDHGILDSKIFPWWLIGVAYSLHFRDVSMKNMRGDIEFHKGRDNGKNQSHAVTS
jgi:O-Antigen ligase